MVTAIVTVVLVHTVAVPNTLSVMVIWLRLRLQTFWLHLPLQVWLSVR